MQELTTLPGPNETTRTSSNVRDKSKYQDFPFENMRQRTFRQLLFLSVSHKLSCISSIFDVKFQQVCRGCKPYYLPNGTIIEGILKTFDCVFQEKGLSISQSN